MNDDEKKSINEQGQVADEPPVLDDVPDKLRDEANKYIKARWEEGVPQEYTDLAAHFRRLAQDPSFIKKFVAKIVNEMEG